MKHDRLCTAVHNKFIITHGAVDFKNKLETSWAIGYGGGERDGGMDSFSTANRNGRISLAGRLSLGTRGGSPSPPTCHRGF